MAVAQVPGKFGQVQRVPRGHGIERLFHGADLDILAGVEQQHVAIGQHHGLLQVQHHHIVVRQVQELAAQMPLVARQGHTCSGALSRGPGERTLVER